VHSYIAVELIYFTATNFCRCLHWSCEQRAVLWKINLSKPAKQV